MVDAAAIVVDAVVLLSGPGWPFVTLSEPETGWLVTSISAG